VVYVVDTHTFIWFIEASPRLSPAARSAIESPDSEIVVPTIVLAEIKFLFARKRIAVDLQTVINRISTAENCTVYPLDEAVIERLPTELNIHDGLIVATALVYRDLLGQSVAVITKDGEINQSGLIDTHW
jgi:PIN domain nuclease of toxin-antitoxin system